MITQIGKRWGCILAGVFGISGVLAGCVTDAVAQITPDTSLGTENSVVTPNVDIQGLPADLIEGGATRGAALFHSFSEFNVGAGLRVYFANPVGIETIFSRVTGSDVSDILGTLGVDGGASLFLLNPHGIIFGENGRLDIAGSFVGSTANAIGFGDQGIFSATEPETPQLLTINPDALFFNQLVTQGTRSIEVRGSLSVPSGESLLLVGGNVAPDMTATGELLIDGGTLEALGGRVELAGVGEPGKVELVTDIGSLGLNFPAELARTDVSIFDSTISVRDADAGDIAIYAQNLSMKNSRILAGIGSGLGSVDAEAGDITINLTGIMEVSGGNIQNGVRSQAIGKAGDIRITASSLSLRDGAEISASTFGDGDAGQVVIQATDSILFDGEDSQGFGSGVYSTVREEAKGDSGRIEIETGSLTLTNGGVVSASIFGEGDGGQVVIQATDSILFDGENSQGFGSGVFSQVGEEAKGNSGRIEVEAGSLTLTNGGVVSASIFGEGDGGQVVIQATDSILFDEENSRGFGSGVYSQVGEEAKGNSGRIEIEAGSLTFTNGGVINTSTTGEGDAGQVVIQARDSILFDGEDSQGFGSGVYSQVGEEAQGNSGRIEIEAVFLTFTNGGVINTSTFGEGNTSQVVIQARDNILFDGENSRGFGSGVFSQVGEEAKGNSLGIEINTGSLILTNGAGISTSTFGEGDAGQVVIQARNSILFDGENSRKLGSGVYSQVGEEAKENSLGIEIDTGSLTFTNGGVINASTFGEGDAGRVKIRARDSILFDGESSQGLSSGISNTVLLEAKGNSLGVEIDTGSLTLTNGAQINTFTGGEGDAGRVKIRARDSILFDGESSQGLSSGIFSFVISKEAKGNSLGVEIDTDSLTLTNGAQINATALGEGDAGRVAIRATDSVLFDGENSLGLPSGIYSQVFPEAKGNSLGIEVYTDSLTLTNGGQINANTFGEGDAGRVEIRARDNILFDGEGSLGLGSGIWNVVASDANGNSLGVEIETDSLTLTNGGVINAATFGEGNAGRVEIRARDSILFDGEGILGLGSGIFSTVALEAKGNSLGIEIETDSLTLTNGASINAETESTGMAGDVDIHATTFIQLKQGSSIRANATASGQAGNLMLDTGHLSVQDGAEVNVSSEVGQAGNLTITADSIVLNHGTISAETAKSDAAGGANISLDDLNLLFLENESLISASALADANGGNVTIDSTFIIALPPTGTEGSDIIANAVQGNGGRVSVTTQGLFDIAFRPQRTPLNDITVSSEFGLDGVFVENRPDIDPNRGLTELENNFVDAERLIDRSCNAGGAALASSFIFTGRGGIPPSPLDVLESDTIVSNWVSLDEETPTQTQPESVTSNSSQSRQIIEAQGWVKLANGQIMLVAESPTVTPQGNWQNTTGCESPESK